MKCDLNFQDNQVCFNLVSESSEPQNVDFLCKYGIRPSQIYNTYWKFAYERQHIFQLRRQNKQYPWTNNDILMKYKFTNTYRASDRVSQYLIKNVIYPDERDLFSPEDMLFRIVLFKTFNKIETWEILEEKLGRIDYNSYSYERYNSVLMDLLEKGERIYSAAYIMPSALFFGMKRKHQNNLKLIEMMMSNNTVRQIAKAHNLKDLFDILIEFPSVGKFLAYQYSIDINYSELCDFNEMDFVVAGPGAHSGISKLFIDNNGYSDEFIIKLLAENQEREFERLGLCFDYIGDRKLQLIDCQNIFCETDKYTRVAFPHIKGKSKRSRIKQLFTPNLSEPIIYFYPPKWRIKM